MLLLLVFQFAVAIKSRRDGYYRCSVDIGVTCTEVNGILSLALPRLNENALTNQIVSFSLFEKEVLIIFYMFLPTRQKSF